MFLCLTSLNVGCSLFAVRPVQEMSDTSAAIRAAHEVNADTLAPELYRQANEWFFKAKNEYKLKNFSLAEEYALKARRYAEQAEFESIRNGGIRSEMRLPDPLSDSAGMQPEVPPPPPSEGAGGSEPYDYPKSKGRPAEYMMQDQQQQQSSQQPGGAVSPTAPTIPTAPGAPASR